MGDTANPDLALEPDIRLAELAFFDFRRMLGQGPGTRVEESGDLVRITGPAGLLGSNNIFDSRLEENRTAPRIAEALEPFARAGKQAAWWLGPSSRPENLDRALLDFGLTPHSTLFGMVRDMEPPRRSAATEPIAGVEPVEDGRTLAELCTLFFAAMGAGPEVGDYYTGVMLDLGWTPGGSMEYFVVRHADRVVACSAVRFVLGCGQIIYVGTDPDHRRQGLGRKVMAAALTAIRRRGLTTAILHATEMGRPLYQLLGFRQVCEFRGFKYTPAQAPRGPAGG